MSNIEPETSGDGPEASGEVADDALPGPGLTAQEEEILLKRLRDMGYVE